MVFKDKVSNYSYFIQVGFIINDVDNRKLQYHAVTAEQITRQVEMTINSHIIYLSEAMHRNGLFESAHGVQIKFYCLDFYTR